MSVAAANFVSRLVTHFPVRHDSPEREQEWLASIVAGIKNYNADVLDRAAQRMIDTRTDRRFPLPAEIRKACADIAIEDASRQPRLVGTSAPDASGRFGHLADELVMGPLGREAARGNWVSALHQFVQSKGRLPEAHEQKRVIQNARDLDDGYADVVAGRCHPEMRGALMKLGASMLARREQLRARVLGAEADR